MVPHELDGAILEAWGKIRKRPMWMLILRGAVAGVIVVAVTLVSQRSPRLGAFLLTLPITSVIAFVSTWQKNHDLPNIAQVARQTLVLVPLALPFFVPLA